jgi:hypothetical protein
MPATQDPVASGKRLKTNPFIAKRSRARSAWPRIARPYPIRPSDEYLKRTVLVSWTAAGGAVGPPQAKSGGATAHALRRGSVQGVCLLLKGRASGQAVENECSSCETNPNRLFLAANRAALCHKTFGRISKTNGVGQWAAGSWSRGTTAHGLCLLLRRHVPGAGV